MKIKQEKQFTLPQLIEWAIDNDIKNRVFVSNPNFDGVTYKLGFDRVGDLYFEESLSPTLFFTVTNEEEITENTVFKQIFETDMEGFDEGFENVSINDVLSPRTESLVVMDKHLEPVTIWTNTEGLVKKDIII